MSIVSSIAVSGLHAASLRLQVAASNIANASSSGPLPDAPNASNFPTAYKALTVTQTDTPDGGTNATVTTASPATVTVSDPTAPFANSKGLVEAPNVDITSQVVDVLEARLSFAANALVLRADDQMTKALLDITA